MISSRNIIYYSLLVCFSLSPNIVFGQTDSNKVQEGSVSMQVYPAPEIYAQFPGGEDAMMLFIAKNLKYPNCGLGKPPKGIVYVEFEIDSIGFVRNPKILRGLDLRFDREVINMVKLMPRWEPAIWDGKPGSSQFTLPVKFE